MISYRHVHVLLLVAFFLSGVASLVHEVVWTRLLRHVMGNTTFAITTVLCVFMAGLALGSYAGGRLIDRRRYPLRLFALLECSISGYCLLLPALIAATEPIYRILYQQTQSSLFVLSLVRFAFCGLLLLIPATFMGATLPVLSRFFVHSTEGVGWLVGRLYSVNTLGAVVGAASAGFLLIPQIGVWNSILLASGLNAVVGGIGWLLHRQSLHWPTPGVSTAAHTAKKRKRSPSNAMGEEIAPDLGLLLLVGYALSGFAALVYEVAWTRTISLLIGSSVYAFSMMLTSFILGLAVGAIVASRFVDRWRNPLLALALVQIGVGLSALVVVPLFGQLPFVLTRWLAQLGDSFWKLQLAEFALILGIMLVPTTLLGATFPLVNRIGVRDADAVGASVGKLYAGNTLGSIFGSFAGGFVLIPQLGIQTTLLVAVTINVAVGSAFLVRSFRLTFGRRLAILGSVFAGLIVCMSLIPRWDPGTITFGPFVQARRLDTEVVRSEDALRDVAQRPEILFHKEDYGTTVTVKQYPNDVRVVYVNAKPDASSTGDLPTQQLLAHVPLLLHPQPETALVIGLASGVTLGSAGRHPLSVLDCAEISPAMVQACRFFDKYNHHILDDPRVSILTADGRNHLALTNKTYDVIISEPSNPWIAGIGDLFTQEFFELCQQRLSDQGIACIWLETYNIDLDSFRSIVRTFQHIFPATTIWSSTAADILMVGAKGDFQVDFQRLSQRLAGPKLAEDIRQIGITSAADFLSHLVMEPEAVRQFAGEARLHTDDNALLEFAAPRILVRNRDESTLIEHLNQGREVRLSFLRFPADSQQQQLIRAAVDRRIQAKQHVLRSRALTRSGQHQQAIEQLRSAAQLHENDPWVQRLLKEGLTDANQFLSRQQYEQAESVLRELLSIESDFHPAAARLALLLAQHPNAEARRPAEAVALAEKACQLTQNQNAVYLETLSIAYARANRIPDAARAVARGLEAARRSGNTQLANTLQDRIDRFRKLQAGQ